MQHKSHRHTVDPGSCSKHTAVTMPNKSMQHNYHRHAVDPGSCSKHTAVTVPSKKDNCTTTVAMQLTSTKTLNCYQISVLTYSKSATPGSTRCSSSRLPD